MSGPECEHGEPGGPPRCALCRLDTLAAHPHAETITRYGRLIRSRHVTSHPAGSPMPPEIRAEIDRALGHHTPTPYQPEIGESP